MFYNRKNKIQYLLMVMLFIGVVSCNSYKKLPDAPQAETNGIVRDSIINNSDTSTIADIPWKEYFKDSKLQALINEALTNNYDMQLALSRISQSEVSLNMARAAYQPTLAVGVAYDNTLSSQGVNGTKVLGYSSKIFSMGFSATWEADLWGKLSNQSKSKYATYLNSVEYRNLVQTNIVSNLATAYYTLLTYDEQLKITKQTITLLEKSSQTIEQLKNAGQQTGAAVEQSKALLYSTQLSVPLLESQIRKQEDAICILVGRIPGPVDRDTIGAEVIVENLSYGVPAQFLAKRPDVKQAEYSFRSAYALTKAAKASLYPSFVIGSSSSPVTFGVAGGLSDIFKPESIAAEIIASLAQPILYKKQLRGNLKITEMQQEDALKTFKYTVLTAGREVSDIIYCYRASLSKNEVRIKQIESLTKAVDFTNDLLMAGEANYTEVLTAQQSLLSAQLNQVSDKLEQLTYSVSLYKALGGGIK